MSFFLFLSFNLPFWLLRTTLFSYHTTFSTVQYCFLTGIYFSMSLFKRQICARDWPPVLNKKKWKWILLCRTLPTVHIRSPFSNPLILVIPSKLLFFLLQRRLKKTEHWLEITAPFYWFNQFIFHFYFRGLVLTKFRFLTVTRDQPVKCSHALGGFVHTYIIYILKYDFCSWDFFFISGYLQPSYWYSYQLFKSILFSKTVEGITLELRFVQQNVSHELHVVLC